MVTEDGRKMEIMIYICANDSICKYMFAIDITNGCFFLFSWLLLFSFYVVVISDSLANFSSFIILD